jgi:hypothetical protein
VSGTRHVAITGTVTTGVAPHQERRDATSHVPNWYHKAGRPSEGEVALAVALSVDNAWHAQECITEAFTQVADNPGPTLNGEGAVLAPVDLCWAQTSPLEVFPVGFGQRQSGQQRGVDEVDSIGVGPVKGRGSRQG